MLVAIHQDERISYPSADGFYSPAERFPEYPFETISKGKNDVYRGLRECLAEAGLDRANYGKKTWNPLGDYIRPGDKVFVLCNFVKHNDLRRGQEDFFAKCTHGSVVRAVIDCVLLALKGKGEVAFGNAPLQSCDWSLVVRETGAERVHEFYRQCGFALPKIQLLDLRQHIIRRNLLGAPQTMFHAEGNDCVEINLDRDSLLEHFYGADKASQPRFRVLDYDPRRTERCHGPGRHVYMMNRQILRSNVVC